MLGQRDEPAGHRLSQEEILCLGGFQPAVQEMAMLFKHDEGSEAKELDWEGR